MAIKPGDIVYYEMPAHVTVRASDNLYTAGMVFRNGDVVIKARGIYAGMVKESKLRKVIAP